MRRSVMIGLGLTASSLLSLLSYQAGLQATPPGAPDYAVAITSGNGLRLAAPGLPAAGGPLPSATADKAQRRTLSCNSVVRLGVVDVGYDCAREAVQAGL